MTGPRHRGWGGGPLAAVPPALRTVGLGSAWLRASIKPWCLGWLRRLSPVPGAAGLGVPVLGCRVFLAGGERVPSPRRGKKPLGEALFPGREDKQGAGAAGREQPPRAAPLGHPRPVPGGGHAGFRIPAGPSCRPKCTPSPGDVVWGSWGPPQGTAPARGSPQLLCPRGSFGLCNPKCGGLLGTPRVSHSGSAGCSGVIYSGAPGNPLAVSGPPGPPTQVAWEQLGERGAPLSPRSHPGSARG